MLSKSHRGGLTYGLKKVLRRSEIKTEGMITRPRRLRICLVTAAYPPTVDGSATSTHDLAVPLVRLGHHVTVLCADRHDSTLSQTSESFESGVRVIRLNLNIGVTGRLLYHFSGLMPLAHSYCIYRALQRYHGETPFDVIEFSNWQAPASIHSVRKLAPQVLRVSTTTNQVASYSEDARALASARKKERSAIRRLSLLEAFSVRRSDLIIIPTARHWAAAAADYGLNYEDQRAKIVPYGVDVSRRLPRTTWACDRSMCRLLFVGRLSRRKGFDVFMNALPGVFSAATEQVYVTIVGPDVCSPDGTSTWQTLFSRLTESTKRRIEYLGCTTDQEREKNYQECDMFVGPSRYESFGLMFVEAMAYGIPVIGSRTGGIPDVVDDEVTGVLVEPDNVRALTEAILRLVNDPQKRREMGRAARDAVIRRFTRERMAQSTIEEYLKLTVPGKFGVDT